MSEKEKKVSSLELVAICKMFDDRESALLNLFPNDQLSREAGRVQIKTDLIAQLSKYFGFEHLPEEIKEQALLFAWEEKRSAGYLDLAYFYEDLLKLVDSARKV